MLRECTTSFTASCLIRDDWNDTLRDALTQLINGVHLLDGPRASGFTSMSNNYTLNQLNVTIEVGGIKNKNKNPVAEKAVRELEEELIRQEPGGRPVSEVGLSLAIARLKSRLRLPGLSAREMWTQRNQYTHLQLTTVPPDEEQGTSLASEDTALGVHIHTPSPTVVQDESRTCVAAPDQITCSSLSSSPETPGPRPQKQRRPPSCLNAYVRF